MHVRITGHHYFSGGVKVNELDAQQVEQFQANIVKTILQIEQTFFDLASRDCENCIIVCDRGVMDPSACMAKNVGIYNYCSCGICSLHR